MEETVIVIVENKCHRGAGTRVTRNDLEGSGRGLGLAARGYKQ